MMGLNEAELCRSAWLPHVDTVPTVYIWRHWSGIPGGMWRGWREKFNARILLAHTGKTGGSSTRNMFYANRIHHDEIHVHPVPRAMLLSHPRVVLCMRDPVARFVSAWEYARRTNRTADIGAYEAREHGLVLRPGAQAALGPLDLFKCFASVVAFAEGLGRSDECGRLAQAVLKPAPPGGVHLMHLTRGYCYYFGGVLDIMRERRQHWVCSIPTTLMQTNNFNAKLLA